MLKHEDEVDLGSLFDGVDQQEPYGIQQAWELGFDRKSATGVSLATRIEKLRWECIDGREDGIEDESERHTG